MQSVSKKQKLLHWELVDEGDKLLMPKFQQSML